VPGIASVNNAKRRPAEFAQERLIELRDDSTRVGVAGQRLDTRNNLAEKALTDVADALLYPARIASRSASGNIPKISTSSFNFISPCSTLPVTTVPRPEILKTPSIGIKKALSFDLCGCGIFSSIV
jgi:hypothetical protein